MRADLTDGIARGYDIGAISAQHSQRHLSDRRFWQRYERIGGLFWGLERLLGVCKRHRKCEHCQYQRYQSCQGSGEDSSQRILIMGSSVVSGSGIPLI